MLWLCERVFICHRYTLNHWADKLIFVLASLHLCWQADIWDGKLIFELASLYLNWQSYIWYGKLIFDMASLHLICQAYIWAVKLTFEVSVSQTAYYLLLNVSFLTTVFIYRPWNGQTRHRTYLNCIDINITSSNLVWCVRFTKCVQLLYDAPWARFEYKISNIKNNI